MNTECGLARSQEDAQQPPLVRKSLSVTFREAIENPDSEAFSSDDGLEGRCGFYGYCFMTFGIVAACSVASIGLWSEMGAGERCLRYLSAAGQAYGGAFVVFGAALLLALYLLDFFCSPHMERTYLRLWPEDRLLGRSLLCLAGASFLALSLIVGEKHPTVPMIVSMFFSPALVLLSRWLLGPMDTIVYDGDGEGETLGVAGDLVASDSMRSFERKMRELRRLTGGHNDQRTFYSAVACAYVLCGALCSLAFAAWASQHPDDIDADVDVGERELFRIRWVAPMLLATSHFLFGLLMWLRVLLHQSYAGTDDVRSRLVVETARLTMSRDILKHRIRAVAILYADEGGESDAALKDRIQEYLDQQCTCVHRLTNVIKMTNAMALALFFALFVAFHMMNQESHYAEFAQGFAVAFAVVFGMSMGVGYRRLWIRMGGWLQDLTLWKSAVEGFKHPSMRALFLMLLLPLAPIVLLLSALNQCIRRARRWPCVPGQIFTDRMTVAIDRIQAWDRLPCIFWCYVWGALFILCKALPILLNVLLAWMGEAIAGLNFLTLLAVTFAAGFFLFMLPPVPGPPIYLFGGFVISERCPWGFWWGSAICVALCFVLKLFACAVQQEVIGGLMSKNLWVRQTCGVHKPFMRAIERVLRRPGFSFGKVMILCGGPDWPTSVLAGIMRVSVWQCLLGTTPIITSVFTLCMSGSFYLKGSEGEVWKRLANLLFLFTGVINMLFWAGLAWAIQDEYEKSQVDITRPKEEFIELEWLDYRSSSIAQRCRITWDEVPRPVRLSYAAGAVALCLIGHVFFARPSLCYGQFQLGDDLAAIAWYGPQGLLRPLGAAGLGAAVANFALLMPYQVWSGRRCRQTRSAAGKALDAEEEGWKAQRLQEARHAASAECLEAEAGPEGMQELTTQLAESASRKELLDMPVARAGVLYVSKPVGDDGELSSNVSV